MREISVLDRRQDLILAFVIECAVAYHTNFGPAEAMTYMRDKGVPERIIARILSGVVRHEQRC